MPARRNGAGDVTLFSSLVPSRTALVVIDMIPFFVSQSAYCRGIVPNVVRLADGLRGRWRSGGLGRAEHRAAPPGLGQGVLRRSDR